MTYLRSIITFALLQWLHKCASVLCYMYITCFVPLLQMICPGGLFDISEDPESLSGSFWYCWSEESEAVESCEVCYM